MECFHWCKTIIPQCLFLSLRKVLQLLILNCWFGKVSSILVSESKHMSILFVINSCTAPILFLKEFTFSAPIVTFLAFCNLCAVTDGKTSFSALSSAELFLLGDLILSTVGLTGLSVLELFPLKTKFFFTIYCFGNRP